MVANGGTAATFAYAMWTIQVEGMSAPARVHRLRRSSLTRGGRGNAWERAEDRSGERFGGDLRMEPEAALGLKYVWKATAQIL